MRKIILSLSVLVLYSCTQQHYYNQYRSVNMKSWKATDTLSFPIEIKEADKQFQYSISVRYEDTYEFSNLWVKVFVNGNGIDTSFRYNLPLFKNDGKPFGEKSGSLITQTIPLKTDLPLSKKGKYEIKLVQLMRKDPLNGISDVGIFVDVKPDK